MAAWHKVRGNAGCAGGDGETIAHFEPRHKGRLSALSRALRDGTYRPGPYRLLHIPKKRSGTRPLAIPSIIDRVAQTAMATGLVPVFEPLFDQDSYGYRPGRSVDMAVARIGALRRQGYAWVAEADIVRCFETIPHDPLLALLERTLADEDEAGMIVDLVAHWLEHAGNEFGHAGRGLPQGSPLSPLLSNLYLDQLDTALEQDGITLVRFADDFVLLAKRQEDAEAALARSGEVLQRHGLDLHSDESRVVDFDTGFTFLGHLFVRSLTLRQVSDPAEDILGTMRDLARQDGADQQVAEEIAEERRAGYDRGGRVLHLQQPDRRLGLSNLSYCVRTDEGRALLTLSPGRVGRIEIGPGAEIETEAIRQAMHEGTDLALTNGAGDTLGWLQPAAFDRAGLHMAQARLVLYPARRLSLARVIVDARLRNMRARLQVLNRAQDPGAVRDDIIVAAKALGRAIRKLPTAQSIEALRGHEGAAAAIYWPALGALCPGAPIPFRRMRPASDLLNAAINYLTAMLERDVRAAIVKVGLHPGFGVLHASADYHDACVWDVMEGPRALLTEGLAVSLFLHRHLSAEMFEGDDPVRIARDGRVALIRGYEAAMDRVARSPHGGRRMAGRPRLVEEARALAQHVLDPDRANFAPAVQDY
ncbi:CRISPR-associated endonuclease Cas1 [Thalassococcus profundi]|uniref:CRISPR-associated endonuclease Cas1 n=1 Tax=Thalassococcus profundi TaxID=2282382 RepID=A0A369TPG8_9RHOB|nr:CRISPR-associated endonuclease Cas1 [Thalassococcus profundi]RDD67173.1 CRISPR-associated endonuclease Cas1 [Thalassococcus profundi]